MRSPRNSAGHKIPLMAVKMIPQIQHPHSSFLLRAFAYPMFIN